MSLSFQTNVTSLVAENNLQVNSQFQANTITQLTSGYRINSSGDDAAGLAVANGLRSQVAELTQGVSNANDGAAILQTIDGGLNNISNILDQLKDSGHTVGINHLLGNRATLNTEFTTLLGEIDRQAANIGLASAGVNQRPVQHDRRGLCRRRRHPGGFAGQREPERRNQYRRLHRTGHPTRTRSTRQRTH